eukprot:1581936-Rhodomonas_salina.2
MAAWLERAVGTSSFAVTPHTHGPSQRGSGALLGAQPPSGAPIVQTSPRPRTARGTSLAPSPPNRTSVPSSVVTSVAALRTAGRLCVAAGVMMVGAIDAVGRAPSASHAPATTHAPSTTREPLPVSREALLPDSTSLARSVGVPGSTSTLAGTTGSKSKLDGIAPGSASSLSTSRSTPAIATAPTSSGRQPGCRSAASVSIPSTSLGPGREKAAWSTRKSLGGRAARAGSTHARGRLS